MNIATIEFLLKLINTKFNTLDNKIDATERKTNDEIYELKKTTLSKKEIQNMLDEAMLKAVNAGNLPEEKSFNKRIQRIKQRRFRRIFTVKKVGNIIELPHDIHEYMYGFDDIVIDCVD